MQDAEMSWRGMDIRWRPTQNEVVRKKNNFLIIDKYVRGIIWGQNFASDLLGSIVKKLFL